MEKKNSVHIHDVPIKSTLSISASHSETKFPFISPTKEKKFSFRVMVTIWKKNWEGLILANKIFEEKCNRKQGGEKKQVCCNKSPPGKHIHPFLPYLEMLKILIKTSYATNPVKSGWFPLDNLELLRIILSCSYQER